MGATTKYYCDFCKEQKNTDELKAIIFLVEKWVRIAKQRTKQIVKRAMKKLEKHVMTNGCLYLTIFQK